MKRMIAIAAMVAVLGGACSSGGSGLAGGVAGKAWQNPPTERGLIDATRSAIDSIYQGDWDTAYRFYNAECRARYGKGDFVADVGPTMVFAAGFMGLKAGNLKRVTSGRVEVIDFTPDYATTAMETMLYGDVFQAMDLTDTSDWTYEEGGWRSTECEVGTLSSDTAS